MRRRPDPTRFGAFSGFAPAVQQLLHFPQAWPEPEIRKITIDKFLKNGRYPGEHDASIAIPAGELARELQEVISGAADALAHRAGIFLD